ncbi:hypothetical protein BMW23_0638 [Bodo saltans virus]|uniref:Uncharacterized protein n=1 Tax=Bodo saltans virus TaxID=2024608 RepID=A0A2H4UUZ6_9VIRU|nr:hypothetical protein QJ851_gp0621 [Bodo saltans virus]ATZ80684.1 hypothetical protein BMW23_0638 [Bodo saltans virus]
MLSSVMLTAFTNGTNVCIFLVLFCNLLEQFIHMPFYKILCKMTEKITNKFIIDMTALFTCVDTMSEKTHPKDEFNDLLSKAGNSFWMLFEWGLPSLLSTVGSMISVSYVFIKNGMFMQLTLCLCVYFVMFLLITKKKSENYSKEDANLRTVYHKKNEYLKLRQQFVSHHEYSTQKIGELFNEKEKIFMNRMMLNKQVFNTNSILNSVICSAIIFLVSTNFWQWLFTQQPFQIAPTQEVLLYYLFIDKLSMSITSLGQFNNQFSRLHNDYDALLKFFEECTYQQKKQDLILPHTMQITHANIKKNDFELILQHPFAITQGNLILIQGKTGGGKTSFLEALTGKIRGLSLDMNYPENYYHEFSDFAQNSVSKLKWSKITLRQLFSDEQNDDHIEHFMTLTMPEFAEIKSRLSKNIMVNTFDAPLESMFSGGQEVRCFIALKVYELFKKTKKFLF